MVVRAGDAFPGVLVIAKGSLRVEALGDVVEPGQNTWCGFADSGD